MSVIVIGIYDTCELNVAVFIQQNVLRLDVAVRDVVTVQVTEGQTRAREVVSGKVQRNLHDDKG